MLHLKRSLKREGLQKGLFEFSLKKSDKLQKWQIDIIFHASKCCSDYKEMFKELRLVRICDEYTKNRDKNLRYIFLFVKKNILFIVE